MSLDTIQPPLSTQAVLCVEQSHSATQATQPPRHISPPVPWVTGRSGHPSAHSPPPQKAQPAARVTYILGVAFIHRRQGSSSGHFNSLVPEPLAACDSKTKHPLPQQKPTTPPPRMLVTLLRDSGYEGPPSKGRGGGAAYFHRRHPTSELYSSLAMEQRLPRGVLRAHPTASLGAQRAERGRAGGSLQSAAG